MTNWYSTAFSPDGIERSSVAPVRSLNPFAEDGGRIAYRRASINLHASSVPSGSELRMMQVRSSDRLIALYLSTTGGFDATDPLTLDAGLWPQGDGHDGPNDLYRNMFVNKEDVGNLALDRVERLCSAASSVADEQRGLSAWEMINATDVAMSDPPRYAKDPHETWDLVLYAITTVESLGGAVTAELYYIPEA